MLLQSQARAGRTPNNNKRALGIEGLTDTSCSVCKDSSHTALTHCRENRLCFLCHLLGHSRRTCPEGRRPPLCDQQENWVICMQGRTAQIMLVSLPLRTWWKMITKHCVTPVAQCHQTKHWSCRTCRLPETNELFYTDVTIDGGRVLRALVDSGSMACTVSETADSKFYLSQTLRKDLLKIFSLLVV